MKQLSLRKKMLSALVVFSASLPAWTQTCLGRDEIPDQARTAIESAAQKAFEQASRGDVNAIKTDSAPSLQATFNGIAAAVNDNKPAFTDAHPQVRVSFLLDTGTKPNSDGHFYCGVFGAGGLASNSAEFDIPGLPAGKYAIVIQDFKGSKGPYALSTIFQDIGGWKLAGFYIRPETASGHDGLWYLQQARAYKAKGENHNAWFYYITSRELLAPVTFMETKLLSKITQESEGIQPKDLPLGDTPISFSANGKTYSMIDMSVFRTDSTFDLAIRYSVPSTSDSNATRADARSLGDAFVAKYPELKDAFNNVMVHAVDASGGDVVGLVKLKSVANP
jgi:hypothetical protein